MTALLLAAALCLIALPSPAAARLAAVLPATVVSASARRRLRPPARLVVPVAGGASAVAVLLAGLPPLVACSAGLAAAAVARIIQRAAAARTDAADQAAAVEAMTTVAAELRAGQQPAGALEAAGAAATPVGLSALLREAAATARLGGGVPRVLRSATGKGADALRWLAAGWQLSATTGAALAKVLDGMARVGRARLRHDQQMYALLSGPRATATLLAGLPAVGIGLGTVVGAQPLSVLFHTPVGQLALLVGVLLELAGLAWTDQIVRSAGDTR
jgi:tight adherence protein B